MSYLKVKVEYLGHVRNTIGSQREEEIELQENSKIADLLSTLSEKYGDSFVKAIYKPMDKDVKSNYIITVNGYLLNQLNGVKTRLKDGDHVILLPVVSGGGFCRSNGRSPVNFRT